MFNATPSTFDQSASNPMRMRRDMQLAATGGLSGAIKVLAPLANTGSIGLTLAPNPALQVISNGLALLVNGTSLAVSGAGVAVNLATNSGLQISAGLLLKLADTSLSLASAGVAVGLATNGGLAVSAGVKVLLANTSLALSALGLAVNPAASSALTVSSGLKVNVDATTITINGSNQLAVNPSALSPLTTKGDLFTFSTVNVRLPVGTNGQFLVAASGQTTGLQWIAGNSDTSLAGSATGLAVALATNSGLQVSAGLLMKLADTSLQLAVGGVSVALNIVSGLAIGAGLKVVGGDKSINVTSVGVKVGLNTNTPLFVGTNGMDLNVDGSSILNNVGQLKAGLATNGGLTNSSGILAKGFRLVAGDAATPVQGDTWFNTTAVSPRCQLATGVLGSFVMNLATWPIATSVTANTVGQIFATDQLAMPAGFLNLIGRTLRIRLHVRMGAAAVANGYTLDVKLDGIVIATWGVNVALGGQIDSAVDIAVTTRTTGATATMFTSVMSLSAVNVVAAGLPTLDLTVARTLQFVLTATTTNAGNTISILYGHVDLVA